MNGNPRKKLFYNQLKEDIVITNRDQMVRAYFKNGHVPFPSYLYRMEVAQKMRLNIEHGGKHSDASFIIDLLRLGSVYFCAIPLMDYYLHPGQDSFHNTFIDQIKLMNYISKTTVYKRRDPLFYNFRMHNLYRELKSELLSQRNVIGKKKYSIIVKLIFKTSPFEYFPRIILVTIYAIFFNQKHRNI